MNERQREQVGRIIAQQANLSASNLSLALGRVRDEFIRAGRAESGMMAVTGAREVERASFDFLHQLVTRIAPVSRTPLAFGEISSAVRRWLRGCEDRLLSFAGSASGLRVQDAGEARKVADLKCKEIVRDIEERLTIEQFDFEEEREKPPPGPGQRRGGRPAAEFWDDMWSAIAAALYDGTLTPKSQAGVERAMAEWISANGHDASSSTVRKRARRLWDRIQPD